MYFFQSLLAVKGKRTIQAKITTKPPITNPHWWEGKPISTMPVMKFVLGSGLPSFDNLFTGTIFDIYSSRSIKMLQDYDINFETFDVNVISGTQQTKVENEYKIFHLLENHPGLDLNVSDIDAREIRKLVLTKECQQLRRPLFRLSERISLVLIHSDLKNVLEENNISGCQYISINDFQVRRSPYSPMN